MGSYRLFCSCNNHFEESCFMTDTVIRYREKKTCLKADEVPTLFIMSTITTKRICDIDNPPPKKRRSAYEKREQYRVSLILRLHCHWKPSQSGTLLKIAPCWPLTGSVYTAIIKVVRVLSIFDLKGGTSGKRITWYIMTILAANETSRQKKRTGRHKNTKCSYTVAWVKISLSRVFGTETH